MAEEAKKWCNDVCQRIWAYLLAQFSQASTYRGLVLIATAAGMHIKPEMTEVIITIGLFVAGFIGAALPDQTRTTKE